MPTIPTTLTIGTLTATNTPITSGAGYQVLAGTGLQPIPRRRVVATSPWVPGGFETSSVQDELTYQLVVQVIAATWDACATAKETLVTQVTAVTWTLVETIGGHTTTYACCAADSIDVTLDPDLIINNRWTVTATIPVEVA